MQEETQQHSDMPVALPPHIRAEIHECAKRLISLEAACIEHGATPQRSVELAEQELTLIVQQARAADAAAIEEAYHLIYRASTSKAIEDRAIAQRMRLWLENNPLNPGGTT